MNDIASSSSLARAREVATAVRDAGGRALIVGGWVRDRLLGRESKDVDIEVFGVPSDRLRALLERLGRVETVGESFQVFKMGDIDVSLPRRESKSGRGHRGFDVSGDPGHEPDRGRAPPRLHHQRDLLGSAGRTTGSMSTRSTAAAIWRIGCCAPSTAGPSATTACGCCGRCSLPPVSSWRSTKRPRILCRTIPLDDLPAERIWGEIEKLLSAPRPSIGLALALDLGVVQRLFPELQALVGCVQEHEWHPEGDVWVHTLQVVDQARTRVDDLPQAQRLAVMLGAVCHDFGKPATTAFLDGRIRSIDHEEQGVAPATTFLDRLNIQSLDGYDVRRQVLGMVAQHLKPGMWFKARDEVGDGAFRRLAQKVDLELLARLAKSDCLGREPGRSTARRWTGSSTARERSASSTGHPNRCFWDATCSRSGLTPGPRWARS